MSQSHTVVFTKFGKATIVRVHGAPHVGAALDIAESKLDNPNGYTHVTTITGIPNTHSPKLDQFVEVDAPAKPAQPTGVIPRLMKGRLPFDGELITNGFTFDCFYKIRSWEGPNAVVFNDNGAERVIPMDQQLSAHLKIRDTVEGEGGTHTREKLAGYFEVAR